MAAIKKCLGVDIGSYSVKIADISVTDNKVKINQLLEVPLEIEQTATQMERRKKAASVIANLIKTKKISAKESVFCLPGQTVFIRKIRLPRTTDERLRRIIEYEARQQIPFPLDKTQKEYQVFNVEDANEVEVILAAIKKEHIAEFSNIIRYSNLKPINISISPLALFNYYNFDAPTVEKQAVEEKKKGASFFSNFLKKKKDAGKAAKKGTEETDATSQPEEMMDMLDEEPFPFLEEVDAYVNIGATNLDLTIVKKGKEKTLGFIRSVPVAGNQVTQEIQNRLGLETFAEAEKIKKEQTAALTIGFEDEPSAAQYNLEASKAATYILDRILAEIRRSLDFYISQPDGMTVDKIVLGGGQVLLPNLREYFEEKLGIPVELKESFENKDIDYNKDSKEEITKYLIALGLAFTGSDLGKININFLPTEQKDIIEFKKKNYSIITLSAILGITILVSTMIGKTATSQYNNLASDFEGKLQKAEGVIKKSQKAEDDRKSIKEKYDKLAQGLRERDYWLKFLEKIQEVKPPDVWLEQIVMYQNGNVTIVGKALEPVSSASFSKNLEELTQIIISAQIIDMKTMTDPTRPEQISQFTIDIRTTLKPSRFTKEAAAVTNTSTQQNSVGTTAY